MYLIDEGKKTVTQYCSGDNLCPCDSTLGQTLTQLGSGSLAYVALDSLGGGSVNQQVANAYKTSNPILSNVINSVAQSTGSTNGGGGGQQVLQGILSSLSQPSTQTTQQVKSLVNEALSSDSLQQAGQKVALSLQQMEAQKIDQTLQSTAKAAGVAVGQVTKNVGQASVENLANTLTQRFQSLFLPTLSTDNSP